MIHGCIDRYSRLVTHLEVATDNLTSTAYGYFQNSCVEYGEPSKIRIDGGSEFNYIEQFMNTLDQEIRCFRGKSGHNVRTERHWRNIRVKVIDKYISIFMCMENIGVLYVLLLLVLIIQEDLSLWRNAHNNYGLRTERYKSLIQL